MVTESEIFLFKTDSKQEVLAVSSPIVKPFKVCAGLAEELKLHLLELSYTEYEVTGSDLVTEALTYLCNTERYLFTSSSLYISEVYENTLCSLGTQIQFALAILGDALECLEHQVELTDIGETPIRIICPFLP